jgi:hypothetical protein
VYIVSCSPPPSLSLSGSAISFMKSNKKGMSRLRKLWIDFFFLCYLDRFIMPLKWLAVHDCMETRGLYCYCLKISPEYEDKAQPERLDKGFSSIEYQIKQFCPSDVRTSNLLRLSLARALSHIREDI